MLTKKCTKCLEEKEIILFSKDTKTKDGLKHYCKKCVKEDFKKYYDNNRLKIIEDKKVYAKKIKEKKRQYDKNYRSRNRHKFKEYNRKKRQKPEFKKWRNDYEKKKRDSDPSYKLRIYISTRIRITIKKNLSFKDSSCLQHLPYSIEELKNHLEKMFDKNMNWDNYGSYWHLDHIIPQKSLPYSSMTEDNFIKCWELKNLRPLRKIENLEKGSKTIEEYNEWKSKQHIYK